MLQNSNAADLLPRRLNVAHAQRDQVRQCFKGGPRLDAWSFGIAAASEARRVTPSDGSA